MAKKRITKWDKGFIQGYICACCLLIELHGNSTLVGDCLQGIGTDIEILIAHDVCESDLERIKPVIEEIERKRSLNADKKERK